VRLLPKTECLNTHWFMSLDDAWSKMEEWRRDYNEVRPHSAIGNKPPISLMNGLCLQICRHEP
jgi:putative transposase